MSFGWNFAAQGLVIQDDVQIAAILGAGVRDLSRAVFRSANRTPISKEFVHC